MYLHILAPETNPLKCLGSSPFLGGVHCAAVLDHIYVSIVVLCCYALCGEVRLKIKW